MTVNSDSINGPAPFGVTDSLGRVHGCSPMRTRVFQITLVSVMVSFAWRSWAADTPTPLPPVNFNRDIRPILSENCFACHGPDQKKRKAKLRLDIKEDLFAKRGDHTNVVPGHRGDSELHRRITTADEDDHMPPAESGKKLSPAQIDLIGRWIDQGATWQGHWAFIKPERPTLPTVKNTPRLKNEIDHFILSKLEAAGLQLSPEATREKLIRRLSLDLTGLPPTPKEIDAFVENDRPDAYEKLVDHLLASPRYGERMALHWLDLARYADTHGYHLDAGREMWNWRDWVIEAFNKNQPFDQFTLEQIAGDLLPKATTSQKLATGFNRNSMINFEGGAIPEEYLTQYIIDRVSTTSTVFLGLTMACAQCHDHKFDPITQKEFYQFYGYFNAVPENGLDGGKGNAGPLISLGTPEQETKLAALHLAVQKAEQQLKDELLAVDAAQAVWEKEAVRQAQIEWTVLDPVEYKSQQGSTLTKLEDKSIVASGAIPDHDVFELNARIDQTHLTAIRLEALRDNSLPEGGPGRFKNSNFVLSEFELDAISVADPTRKESIAFASATADFSQSGFPVAKAIDGDKRTGWAIDAPSRHKSGVAWFASSKPFGFAGGTELRFRLRFEDEHAQHALGRSRLAVSTDPAAAKPGDFIPPEISSILAIAEEQRTKTQRDGLQKYYRETFSPAFKQRTGEVTKLRKSSTDFQKSIPTSMVMEQMANPRDTFVLVRGQYNNRGEKVVPGVPASLSPLQKDAPPNRLGLAEWLVDPSHPLMARVTINRFWAMVMGSGLVKTANNFGAQAEWPSHPELLDWLATEFIRSGWNVKHMMKLLVTSATYRQSAVVTRELEEKDPDNRLYARGPRFRLSAEAVRDNALAISGLLAGRIGGPSVSPYQPPGLWEELSSRKDSGNWTAQRFVQSHGEDLYRRGMYTFWKRTSPPPSLQAFDAPDRETCTVQRDRTTTPLQALVLMNDPTYVEAARALAERMMTEAKPNPADRIGFAFRLALARRPTDAETKVLLDLYEKQIKRFAGNPDGALKLINLGEAKRNEKLDVTELAAWTSIASMILNLDETITKG